jgi:hypothetical protein
MVDMESAQARTVENVREVLLARLAYPARTAERALAQTTVTRT